MPSQRASEPPGLNGNWWALACPLDQREACRHAVPRRPLSAQHCYETLERIILDSQHNVVQKQGPSASTANCRV